jgi:cysteine desulfuration protein SufE
VGESREGRCYFRSDAESPVVRGLVGFLCEFFNGASTTEIASTDIDPLTALDLTRNLSPTRRNGLTAARHAILAFARGQLANP